MKILSVILATLILFLTVQPLLAQVSFIAKAGEKVIAKCCAGKPHASLPKQQPQKESNCCNNGQCNNPFLSCANCYFINRDGSAFLVAPAFKQTEKIRLMNDKILSSYIQDFWHPPQFV